jgi:GT2 family glycosyltransferase
LTHDSEHPLTVSVIVPTFNRKDRLARMLRALDAVIPSGLSLEAVVVVDGATDGTEELLATLQTSYPLRVLTQKNAGPGAARNRAIAAATGDILIFLDDDVIPTEGLITHYLEIHRRDPHAVITGPMIAPPGMRLAPWLQWEADTLQKQYDAMEAGRWAPTPRQFYTANASTRRADVLAAGGFDERYTRAEDVEMAFRMADRGARFYFVPAAAVLHEPDRTFAGWMRVPYEYGRHDVLMARGGRPLLLELAYREWSERHLLNRLAPRLCVGRPWRKPLTAALSALVKAKLPRKLVRVQIKVCSVLFTMQYWQGIADATGTGARVWQGPAHHTGALAAHPAEVQG